MNTRRQRLRRLVLALLFLALPITLNYYSPYLMTSGTAERVATFSFAFWLTVFATAFVLGRSFCGWACPFNGLQQLWESVAVRPLKRVRFLPFVKYALWAAWVAAVFGIGVAVGGWTRFDPFYMTENGVSVTEAGNLVTYFLLVGSLSRPPRSAVVASAATCAPSACGASSPSRSATCCTFRVWLCARRRGVHLLRLLLKVLPDAASRQRDGCLREDAVNRVFHVRDLRRCLSKRCDPARIRASRVVESTALTCSDAGTLEVLWSQRIVALAQQRVVRPDGPTRPPAPAS